MATRSKITKALIIGTACLAALPVSGAASAGVNGPAHVFSPFKYTPCAGCPVVNIYDPYQPVTSICPPPSQGRKAPVTTHAVAPFYDLVFSPHKTVTYYEYDATGKPVRPPYVNIVNHQVYTQTKDVHGKPYIAYKTTHVARPTVVRLNVGGGKYETRTIRNAPTNIVYGVRTSDVMKSRTIKKTQTKTIKHDPTTPAGGGGGVSLSVNNNNGQSSFYVYLRSPNQSLNSLAVSPHADGRMVAGTTGAGRQFYINGDKQLADSNHDIVFFDDPETSDVSSDDLYQLKIGSVPNRDMTVSSIIALEGDVMNFRDEEGQQRGFYACPVSGNTAGDYSHVIKVASAGRNSDMGGCSFVKLAQDVSFTGMK